MKKLVLIITAILIVIVGFFWLSHKPIKDISKYREIGPVTKYLLSSRSPWCIPESVLDREDLKILKQIIKQHVQDCDFE